jgi:hypothetical protein
MAAIFLTHCGEFQPQSPAGLYMTHNRFGMDLAFLDKKIKASLRAHSLGLVRQDKQTAGAEIANLRSIVIPVGAPADIDVARRRDSRAEPSRVGSWLVLMAHDKHDPSVKSAGHNLMKA